MGHLDVVKLLVERGAELHHMLNGTNQVSQAENAGHFEVARYLQSQGAQHPCEFTPPDFDAAHRIIVKTFTEERGPTDDWSVEVPGEPGVCIHSIPAGEKWQARTLFTLGLSDKNQPIEKQYLFQCREFRMMLPGDWPFTEAALQDPKWNWPVEYFKGLVRRISALEYFPDDPVLFMNGDPAEPLAEGTDLCGWLCIGGMGEYAEFPDYRIAEFYDLYPIYAEEAELLRRENSTEALTELFEEHGIPLHVDPVRQNVG